MSGLELAGSQVVTSAPRATRLARTLRFVLRRPGLLVGLALLVLLVLAAVVGPYVAPHDPYAPSPAEQFTPPSAGYPLGTDEYGRDILSRLLHATRLDLSIAVAITALALTAGVLIGSVAGFYGGAVDEVVMRVVDVLQSFPSFILAMGVTAMLGNRIPNVILAVALAYTPYFIRLTRAEMLAKRQTEYADAARCLGNPPWRVMLVHLLPNCLGPALVQATLTLGWGVLDVAGLSFLGLGITPPEAEWGVMVSEGSQNIFSGQWWTSLFPGAAVGVAVLAFNLIADGLREAQGQPDRG